jgi:Secretion system C-terminal sorting domain
MKRLMLILLSLPLFTYAQIITTIAGNGTEGFRGDGGPAIYAEFSTPAGVISDKSGNIYVVDDYNDVIHKIDSNGIMTRFAGNGRNGYSGDGGQATAAQLSLYIATIGLAIDAIGNVYFSDGNVIRKVSTSGIISTFAGNGIDGSSGDGGPSTAAELFTPTGIAFDKIGNLYICDQQENVIRKVSPAGIISTIAGTTIGFSGDGGQATNAQLKWPTGIAVDDSGNIFFADFYNDVIRKISSTGIITTIAGDGPLSIDICDGCLAKNLKIRGPMGLSVDKFGNVYASGASAIHKITKNGLAYTIAGDSSPGYWGDGGAATSCRLYSPTMICFDNYGNLIVADRGNNRFRKIWMGNDYFHQKYYQPSKLSIYPNPVLHSKFTCNIISPVIDDEAKLVITNVLGQFVCQAYCTTNKSTTISVLIPPGLYFITAYTSTGHITSKLFVE